MKKKKSSICVRVGLKVFVIRIASDKKIPPKNPSNPSETRLCRVSDEFIQVLCSVFLVPQPHIMMGTFSRSLCFFSRFYMNSVSTAYVFFLDFWRLFQSKK